MDKGWLWGQGTLHNSPGMPWGWDNLGKVAAVFPYRFGQGAERMPNPAVCPSPGEHGGVQRLQQRLGGAGGAQRWQRACGAFLTFPACCRIPLGR